MSGHCGGTPQWAMRMSRSFVALVVPLVFSACSGGAGSAPSSAQSPALGTTTTFALPSNEGALVTVPQPNTRVTIVDAFAPTCEPCAKKVPGLLAHKAALRESGAMLVLVAVLSDGESDADAAAALKRWGAESPFLVDRGDVLRRELAIDKLPGTVILEATGKVRWVAPAEATASDVVAAARD